MNDPIRFSVLTLVAAGALSACSLAPTYNRSDADLAKSWTVAAGAADTSQLQDIPWEKLYTDEHLRGLIRISLERNHDLRIAVGLSLIHI